MAANSSLVSADPPNFESDVECRTIKRRCSRADLSIVNDHGWEARSGAVRKLSTGGWSKVAVAAFRLQFKHNIVEILHHKGHDCIQNGFTNPIWPDQRRVELDSSSQSNCYIYYYCYITIVINPRPKKPWLLIYCWSSFYDCLWRIDGHNLLVSLLAKPTWAPSEYLNNVCLELAEKNREGKLKQFWQESPFRIRGLGMPFQFSSLPILSSIYDQNLLKLQPRLEILLLW